MAITLQVPNEFGYVLLVASSSALVNVWHGTRTVKFRKLSGIGYPNTFATPEQAEKSPAAYGLNCAQRAHANFTENLTPWVILLFSAGLRNPVAAAALGASWLVSRIVYTVGYTSSKGPKGRVAGSLGHYLSLTGLLGLAGYTGYSLIVGN